MSRIREFYGNPDVVRTLEAMMERDRIPQTILLAGPEGIGKATLARRFAGAILGAKDRLEGDDLSRPENVELISEREKLPAEKRSEDPLMIASHPDFVTFPPDGPLRQVSIQQMRVLRERARYKPLHGQYRVFLIDGIDRANEQAANSLLKTLEEPPDHLILILTARNPYDLLPTIRSRSVILSLGRLSDAEMDEFINARGLNSSAQRTALADGSPGLMLTIDLESWEKRRAAMLKLLKVSAGLGPFAEWAKMADSVGAARSEKLDGYMEVLYSLLEDVLRLQNGSARIRNVDVKGELESLAREVDFEWVRKAVSKLDELVDLVRRNIQKSLALDALVSQLRPG